MKHSGHVGQGLVSSHDADLYGEQKGFRHERRV